MDHSAESRSRSRHSRLSRIVAPRVGSGRASQGAYDPVARALHWLVAAAAVIVVALGWAIPGAARESGSRELLLLLHRSFGLLIIAMILFRGWWRLSHPPPPLPSSLAAIEVWAAHSTHLLLYVFFVLQPLSGYINAAAAGHTVSFFGVLTIPALIADSPRLSQIADAVHLGGQFLIYALVGAHVAAALMHGLIRRDGVFERMLPRRRAG
jgi:cytochrome b561